MRALVFASVCKDLSNEAVEIMAKLAFDNDTATLNKASELAQMNYDQTPKLLDMFGGGGTIAFESKSLGLDTYSIDANELSVLIQKSNLEYPDDVNLHNVDEIVRESGERVLGNLKEATEWLYPLRKEFDEKLFGYLWTYTKTCDHCGYSFYLSKRPWLSKKKGKNLAFSIIDGDETQRIEIDNFTSTYKYPTAWQGRTSTVKCPKCGEIHDDVNIANCKEQVVGLIANKKTSGKEFIAFREGSIPNIEEINRKEQEILIDSDISLPTSKLPKWSGIVNPALYGIDTHADFLNRRQRLLLIYLIKYLKREYKELASKYEESTAKYVISALSSLVDQIVDWNCRLSMWIPQNEQVGRAFCGPGVAMLWDYIETDQLLKGPANLWGKLERIINGLSTFPKSKGKITIQKACAQELPFKDNFFDAIVTDPPYYDNIYYSILADFFYSWKKEILKEIEPQLFETNTTDYEHELVASSIRNNNDATSAHEKYCFELEKALNEAARVLKPNGVFSFIYSHSSVNGWDAIIQAYRNSPFIITSVQPLSIERKGRPRAVLSEAVNTCMTFVARKSAYIKRTIEYEQVVRQVQEIIESFTIYLMEDSGWNASDAGMATLAYAVGLMANAHKIDGVESDRDALIKLSKVISDFFPSFKVQIRKSL